MSLNSSTIATNFAENLYSLSLAITKLVNKEEKIWGYFQVEKIDEDLYLLNIPYLPALKLHQGSDIYSCRGFWERQESPVVYIRKKQKKVPIKHDRYLEKKQRIYEIVYQTDYRLAIHTINQMLITAIRDKITQNIEQNIEAIPEDEIKPVVVIKTIGS